MARLDAIIVSGDAPQEFLGKNARERMRLTIQGIPASLNFLREYFRAGRDPAAAVKALQQIGRQFVSLNGPYLCQYLEQRGFSVALITAFTEQRDRLLELLAQRPRAVVLSTTFLPFASQIDAMARFVKEHAPGVTVIAGGIQVWKSYQHRGLLDEKVITEDIRQAVAEHNYLLDVNRPSPVDVLVVSECGEWTLARLLDLARNGGDYRSIENVAWFEDGAWRINPVVSEPPVEVKVDWGRFFDRPSGVYVPIQAGQGCGFRCAFCDFRGLRSLRVRTPASVVEEIRTIPPNGGVRRAYFTDDNLFSTRKRAREVCSALAESGMAIKWRGMFRISIVDDATASLMAESGCTEVLLGIESGDPEILSRMGKKTTADEILKGIEILGRHGISTKSTFIIGFPGETDRSIRNTIDLLNAYPTNGPAAHRYLLFTFAVMPLSAIASAESRERYDLRGYGYRWKHATMTSEEAEERMSQVYPALKPELSPSYVLEVAEMPGLTVENIKAVYTLRNRILRSRLGITTGENEAALWSEIEKNLSGAVARPAEEMPWT